jgi:hypothetical protein
MIGSVAVAVVFMRVEYYGSSSCESYDQQEFARHVLSRLQFHEQRMTPVRAPLSPTNQLAATHFSGGWWPAFLLCLCVSLLIVAPFFWRGVASGHDFEFHATSWLDVAGQWKQGILYPRWAEWANHGFGEPRFIFYPPFSWLLAPALSFLVPWDYVPVAFIVLVQTFAGLSAFAFVRRMLPRGSALFAAAGYTANPNALLMIYFRSDYAELLASAFFPLLFLAALQLTGITEAGPVRKRRTLVFFSVVFAAIWLSNAPAGVMATYSVTLLFAWAALARSPWIALLRGTTGLALGFGLATFYIVPAAYEQRWVNIAQALSPGLLPSENFLYTTTGDPEHTYFNFIASTIAITLIAFTGIAAIAAGTQFSRADESRAQRQVWNALLLVAAISTALMMRPAFVLWQWLPKLRFVQFPWRWMSILTIPFIYFLAAAFSRGRFRSLWVLAAAGMITSTGVFFVRHTWWDVEEFSTLRAAVASGEGFDGTDEYDPIGDDHYNLPANAPRARLLPPSEDASNQIGNAASLAPRVPAEPGKIFVERWTPEEKIVQVDSPRPARLALRLLNYPAWQVEVNSSRIQPESAEDSGQMVIPIPLGQSRIHVRFIRTRDRTAGIAISIGSLFIGLVVFLAQSRERAAQAA